MRPMQVAALTLFVVAIVGYAKVRQQQPENPGPIKYGDYELIRVPNLK